MPKVDPVTFARAYPKVFFGGDAAFGPKNIITAVAHGHEAAISIDLCATARTSPTARPDDHAHQPEDGHPRMVATTTPSRSTGVFACRRSKSAAALKNLRTEVELGFNLDEALAESRRCLNCDVETVFTAPACIECDACVDICPLNCISFVAERADERRCARSLRPPAINPEQAIYVSEPVKTARVMVKDEDLCLHCGLCAERCPTGAWDMQKFILISPKRGNHANPSGKRFRHPFRQHQRIGLGERQSAVRSRDPAHGRADRAAQHLSLQHPGPADLVRGQGQRKGLSRRARRGRHDGGDEPADLRPGRRLDRARRLFVLRFDAAAAPRRMRATTSSCSACRSPKSATPHYSDPRQRQLYKNIIYVGALAALLDIERGVIEQLLGERSRARTS